MDNQAVAEDRSSSREEVMLETRERRTFTVNEARYFRVAEGRSFEIDGSVQGVGDDWTLDDQQIRAALAISLGLPSGVDLTLRFLRK